MRPHTQQIVISKGIPYAETDKIIGPEELRLRNIEITRKRRYLEDLADAKKLDAWLGY